MLAQAFLKNALLRREITAIGALRVEKVSEYKVQM